MQNTIIIFENSLLNLDKTKANELLQRLSFNLFYQNLQHKNELLLDFLKSLKKLEMLDETSTSLVIKAFVSASIKDEQNTLFSYMNEYELLSKKIQNQKINIKNQTSEIFSSVENLISLSDFKDEFRLGLSDAILFDIDMLGILKETAESAFLITLEKAEDIERTTAEIAKNLAYNAICESDFQKERILQISGVILSVACELANASIPYAKELVRGVIRGIQEGICLATEKLKNSFNYTQTEFDIRAKNKELIGIEDELITLLREEARRQSEPCRGIIEGLLENELDSFFARLKRLASESREQLKLALNELKKSPKIDDFSKNTQAKIESFKQEILRLESVKLQNYKDINLAKAKRLGTRLWERAKKLLSK